MEKAIFKSLSSILWIVMIWAGIYAFLVYKDMRFAPESYFAQILLATIFFLSSMVSVPFNEERILVLRLLNREIKTLGPGTYFYPFLGFWGKIYIPIEFREDKKVVHIDTRLMRKHEIKNWKEDLIVTIMTTFFPMVKKFSFWNLFFCLILGSLVGYGAVKIKKEYFPSTKPTKVESLKNRVEKALSETVNVDNFSTNSINTNSGDEPVYSREVFPEYSDREKKYIVEKYIASTGEYKGEKYEDLSGDQKGEIIQDFIYRFGEPDLSSLKEDSKARQISEPEPVKKTENYDDFISKANITFIPHLILRDYPKEEIDKYLYQGYYFTGIKLIEREEIFRIVDEYDNEIPEMDCFAFIFAYQGRLYDSQDKTPYIGRISDSMLRDIQLSTSLPRDVYVINGRSFYFYGYAYNP